MYIIKPNNLSDSDNTYIIRVYGHYVFWSANSATIKHYREKLSSNLGAAEKQPNFRTLKSPLNLICYFM